MSVKVTVSKGEKEVEVVVSEEGSSVEESEKGSGPSLLTEEMPLA